MARHISYYRKGDTEYARVAPRSVRVNGLPRKVKGTGIELGKVIDKEQHVFCSRERGVYTFDPETGTYDPETGTYGAASEHYLAEMHEDRRKRKKIYLDFGDAYFLSEYIQKIGYSDVVDSVDCENRDLLNAMILYYTLFPDATSHAELCVKRHII